MIPMTGGTIDAAAILNGALLGLLATILGWVKNGGRLTGFQAKGLVLKMPVGVVLGALAAWKGISFEDATTWAMGIGLVGAIDGTLKTIVRRFYPEWLVLDDPPAINPLESRPPAPPPPALPPSTPTILALVLALPFLGGCFDSPPEVMRGHDTAAVCVQRASENYRTTIAGMAMSLRAERRVKAEYALKKSADNIRLKAAKQAGQIDAEEAIKYLQAAYDSRDAEIAAMEGLIAKYQQAAAAGDREASMALGLMGELRKYDAAGANPEKLFSEASSMIAIPLPKPEDFPEK